MMLQVGALPFRVKGFRGYRVQDFRFQFRVLGLGFWVQGLGRLLGLTSVRHYAQ